jgi:hypothetical protein
MFTDTHGDPDLLADHSAPTTGGGSGREVDATDYYGFWKTFDGLRNCAFYGTDCLYGVGNTPEHRYMGLWSDDVPVTALRITDYIPSAETDAVGGIAEAPDSDAPSPGGSTTTNAVIAATTAVVVVLLVAVGGWRVYSVRRR